MMRNETTKANTAAHGVKWNKRTEEDEESKHKSSTDQPYDSNAVQIQN